MTITHSPSQTITITIFELVYPDTRKTAFVQDVTSRILSMQENLHVPGPSEPSNQRHGLFHGHSKPLLEYTLCKEVEI